MTTKKFPKQDLLDLLNEDYGDDFPYKMINDDIIDNSRWSIIHNLIFSHEGRFWWTDYRVGATEQQDERPWEYDGNEISCTEVTPVEKMIVVYEVVKEATTPSPAPAPCG